MTQADSTATSDLVLPAFPWLVVLQENGMCRQKYVDELAYRGALADLARGRSPDEVVGWTARKLRIAQIRSVAWVPSARTAIIRFAWWRDPWRFTAADAAQGEAFFQNIARRLPSCGTPTKARVGPNDLEVDPRFLILTILVLGGFFALVGGATEGLGAAPMPILEWLFRLVGRAVGLAVVLVLGGVAVVGGMVGLAWWHRHRPIKIVVRANGSPSS